MGRLCRDPDVRWSNGEEQTCIARFSLAVDRKFKREGGAAADFFNCTCFGKLAEFCDRYLNKGTKILLTGRVQNDNYTNRDGQKVYSVQIIVEEIEFAESKSQDSSKSYSENTGNSQPGANNYSGNYSGNSSGSSGSDFMMIDDSLVDELPFS